MSDGRDDDAWPGESYDTPKNEVAEPTGTPGSVQEVVSDPEDESGSGEELKGELNEVAPVTDTPGSVQEVVEGPGDECECGCDGEVGDGE